MRTISDRVMAVIAAKCEVPVDSLDEQTQLRSLRLDSMMLMEVSLSLEYEFERPVDDGAFASARTVGDLVRAMESPAPA